MAEISKNVVLDTKPDSFVIVNCVSGFCMNFHLADEVECLLAELEHVN